MRRFLFSFVGGICALFAGFVLSGCGENVSYVQKESSANAYKDYRQQGASVVGIGEPISKQQVRANATMDAHGRYQLDEVIRKFANTYNVAVRWGQGVRKERKREILISKLTFDEIRSYLEDVYEIQIIREGERRLLLLPSAEEPRIEEFAPGVNVSLSQAVRGLAAECGMNLVVSENKSILAETLVTTSLRDVTCRDAMNALLVPHGLSLVDAGDYFTIGGFPTREWVVNLYEPIRTETQRISYASEFGSDEGEDTGETAGSVNVEIRETRDLWLELQNDLTSLVDKSCEEGDAQSQTSASVLPPPSLLDDEEPASSATGGGQDQGGSYVCGYVRVNRSVGMVQMRAPVPVLEQADQIIRRVEDIASRRLLVEARIMAVSRERGFQQGASIQGSVGSGRGYQTGVGHQVGFSELEDAEFGNLGVAGRLATFLSDTSQGGFAAASGGSIDVIAKLAENFGTTYQFMAPTIEVMDRQKAVVVSGRNEKYFLVDLTREDNDDDGTIDTEEFDTEVFSQFIGLQFAVTAQVADRDSPHTLAVQVPILELQSFKSLEDGTASAVPIVNTRIIDQKVRIHDGEIKVVGGLVQTIAIDRESGVPLLRGIPMAGKLLNEENISYEDVEFIVLLKARRIY